ncbi:hypothetical protein L1049_012655 [Liquidambar formosana]|uniref:Malectin-like domain-containing protein n=1 Tax=Liquidambar formosana TaxID=63359 RepID=A0AAP0N6W4_LIQFO
MPSASDGTTTTGVASNPDPEVPKVPYITARIIYSSFTYAFPLSPGPKFIRLYFHVASYSGLNPSKAYFSVVAGRYTLLSDFRPSVTADSLNSTHFTRDFSVYVKEGRLNITFNPSPTTSNAFAFVNGIEIFSMPLNLYIPHGNGSLPFIGQHDPFIIHDDETALEMLYQVNVGVLLERVITSIFGAWIDDLSYISGSQHGISVDSRNLFNAFNYTSGILLDYAAPLGMYSSARTMENDETFNVNYNLTWTFPVDSGFKYLVRLHFCEISFEVTQVNQRVFNVYINNQTAENALDLVALTGAPFVTVYRDYVVMVPNGTKNKQDLWLALHPNMESKPKYANAILNGIEILKLSDGSNNLAAYERLVNEPPAKKRRPFSIIVGGVFGGIAGLFLICYTVVHIARNGGKRVSACAARVSQFSTADRHRNANILVWADDSSYVPLENIALNCGSSSLKSSSYDGRNWSSDIRSQFVPATADTDSIPAEASFMYPAVPEVPYKTARIFRSQFTFTFDVTPGPKFVRLHFYPSSYLGLNASKAFLSVTALGGRYSLLKNFSASLNADYLNFAYLMREFTIYVSGHILDITFTPSSKASDAYAFVNGIELVSTPLNLYIRGADVPISFIGYSSVPFYIDYTSALETMYRLNVGGQDIEPNADSGLFRRWTNDQAFIFGAADGVNHFNFSMALRYPKTVPLYTAPQSVYRTARTMFPNDFTYHLNYNLSWFCPIDSGFNYLVRLHFCELDEAITKSNQRVFQIFIDNQTAEDDADVVGWSGGRGVPVFKDYVVMMEAVKQGKQDLWLDLHPNMETRPQHINVILNGVEIFKLSSDGNLAGLNPLKIGSVGALSPIEPSSHSSEISKKITFIIIGCSCGGVVLLFLLCLLAYWLKNIREQSNVKKKKKMMNTRLCHNFSINSQLVNTHKMAGCESKESSRHQSGSDGAENAKNDAPDMATVFGAVVGIAVAVCGIACMASGSGSINKKTMKAPGRNYCIYREDFQRDPAGYFRDLRK